MDHRFKKLFEPIQVGSVTIPNRIYMPSMCMNYGGPRGESTLQDVGYFEARARGGAGLICIDYSCISPEGRGMVAQRGLWDDNYMPNFTRIVDVIRARGVRATTQIHHAGANAMIAQPVAPSRVSNFEFFITKPRELATEEVEEIVEKYADAAFRGKTCGLDMVEIHGTHGYLVSQFISPLYNLRTDKYGRDKPLFAVEVVRKIKEKCGTDFPVIFRFNANEFTPGGITLDYSKEVAKRLVAAGVDMFNVTGGFYDILDYLQPHMYIEDEMEEDYYRFIKMASEIKKVVSVPIVSGGLISDPFKAEKLLEEGVVDMVFIARQLFADPDWPKKVRSGRLEDIRPCILCMDGCIGRNFFNKPGWCTVNALSGFEYRWRCEAELPRPLRSRKVMIIGAGPAGLEAARICAIRGHQVTIIDKADRIGGTLNMASIPSFKKRLRQLVEWYNTQLNKLEVDIRLNTEATESLIKKIAPDAVVMASGSEPVIPNIPGIDKAATADDVLLGKKEVGARVVIIGGGLVGLDTALWLAKQGKQVTVIEALTKAGTDMETSVRMTFFRKSTGLLDKYHIKVMTQTPAIEVRDEGVVTVGELGCQRLIECDNAICAVGRCSTINSRLAEDIEEIYIVGDAREPRKIIDAIHEGFTVALDI